MGLQRRGGHLTPLLLWRMLKAVFGGGWMTSSLSSVLHICSEWARLESLMPVVLAGRPSEGSRRAELRVGEARRLSFDGSRQRPAAAQRAPLLDARLRPELRLAQLQQWHYLLPQCHGFEPASCQVEKGFDERLQAHPCEAEGQVH